MTEDMLIYDASTPCRLGWLMRTMHFAIHGQ